MRMLWLSVVLPQSGNFKFLKLLSKFYELIFETFNLFKAEYYKNQKFMKVSAMLLLDQSYTQSL